MRASEPTAPGPEAGVVLLDKPEGISSHAAVSAARRRHGGVKAGHAGTLDPFATGLLIVLLRREATREQARFVELEKTYLARAHLGARSSTGDPTGEIIETGRMPAEPLELPTGRIEQIPPAYSAIKVGGRRAYKRARAGETVSMPPRLVDVHRFELRGRETDPPCDQAEFEIECSSGTYVRSLISGLGDAYCLALRRTRIGPFDVAEADSDHVIPIAEALERVSAHASPAARVRRR